MFSGSRRLWPGLLPHTRRPGEEADPDAPAGVLSGSASAGHQHVLHPEYGEEGDYGKLALPACVRLLIWGCFLSCLTVRYSQLYGHSPLEPAKLLLTLHILHLITHANFFQGNHRASYYRM